MDITVSTTPREDAAILALTKEAPDVFVLRHVRHQIDFAIAKTTPSVADRFAAASPDIQAQIEVLLARVVVAVPAIETKEI